ncbi:ABC transporter ATP-binding protein [Allorhodopirellula solitaria]|uniref:Putative ABC transporter ATP-binding protein YxlF n=1 Tax=Allorhodopirellula solitaria TaxID=2527987 RepID=A0A5C5XR55_9BACT|nr:ABC transporter ATP-binding protein [Allorhodopirellula solitaria]TWT65138.1 putative ABC transporter ATP-binding protein YxlF [Allorhodopirellula solitaria]
MSPAEASSNSIISVDCLEKTYRGGGLLRRSDVCALQGVSLHADAGQVFGLLGPNGAGKTTLIKVLLGVIGATGGKASLFGLPAGSSAARRRVGYLPESLRVDRHHTARSALSFYGKLNRLDSRTIARRSDELIDLVGLRGRDRESVKRFSKGMLQRLGLAQSLMHDPDLLILDEPTDGLDPVGRSEVRRIIEQLRDAGKTIFLNSHILHEVELICTHLAIMAKGKVLATGPISEMDGPLGPTATQIAVEIEFELPNETDHSEHSPVDSKHQLDRPAIIFQPAIEDSVVWVGEPLDVDNGRSRFRCRFLCEDRMAVDEIVDRLRGADGSLIRLVPHRQSLEETFMRLVQSQEQDNVA